ncbi:MAG: polymorphic toxin-type HINT domain-containing protein, partial [Pirellula staleyi]
MFPEDEPEPEQATWRLVELEVTKANGDKVEVKLLRPLAWLEQAGAITEGVFDVNVQELDLEGKAAVLQILPCPPIQSGEGQVVTGTFRHTSDSLVELQIEGEPQPIICTSGHLIWSDLRQEFVAANDLRPNESIRLICNNGSRVSQVALVDRISVVFNLEVNNSHTYFVGQSGVLVHNGNVRDGCEAPNPTVGRQGAFRGAKRDAGLSRSQQPDSMTRVPMTDRNGKAILNANGKPIMTREYTFTRPDGS